MKRPVFYVVYRAPIAVCSADFYCVRKDGNPLWCPSWCEYRTSSEEVWTRPVFRFDWRWRDFQRLGEYRQGTSYRKNPEHQKKEKDPYRNVWRNSKKDWRHGKVWKRGGKARGECLKMARRIERRWVKAQLHIGNHEDIELRDNNQFYDPWDWN